MIQGLFVLALIAVIGLLVERNAALKLKLKEKEVNDGSN